jgi:4-hydroxybenzoate polyprenyltransferase
VDLDGTLLATDTMAEGFLGLLKTAPWKLLGALAALMSGRAKLKRYLAQHAPVDPATLPYRDEVLEEMRQARYDGRQVLLVTASDQATADAVAGHIELADLPIWKAANEAIMVWPSSRTRRSAQQLVPKVTVLSERPNKWKAAVKELRPHQWAKNVLLFVPLYFAHQYTDLSLVFTAVMAFFSFSFCASSIYVLNDLVDLPSDRQHRSKRKRPLAAGALSIPGGIALSVASLALVDVLTLASLFTYRVMAGGVAVDVSLSPWLLAFSIFFFTSLAFVKRYAELIQIKGDPAQSLKGRDYVPADIPIIASAGPAAGLLAVLVFALYINSPAMMVYYSRPEALWGICLILVYWIIRIWFLAARDEMHDDPVLFAVKDKISLAAGALVVACLLVARYA